MKFKNNPCEKHLDVSIDSAAGFCPICLVQERDQLRAENAVLQAAEAQLKEISALVSFRHGDDEDLIAPPDEEKDDPFVFTLKKIFEILDGNDDEEGNELHVYSNDIEFFVARDPGDLAKVYAEFCKATMEEMDEDPAEFERLDNDSPIKIFLDDDGSAFPTDQWPQGAKESRDENGKISLTAPAGAWAKSNGRGFLCSTEY